MTRLPSLPGYLSEQIVRDAATPAPSVYHHGLQAVKFDQFKGAKGVPRIIAEAGGNAAMIQAGSLLFDSAIWKPSPEYVARTFDENVAALYNESLVVRHALEHPGHWDDTYSGVISKASEQAQTIMIAGILLNAFRASALPYPQARTLFVRMSYLLRWLTNGNGPLYAAACKHIHAGMN